MVTTKSVESPVVATEIRVPSHEPQQKITERDSTTLTSLLQKNLYDEALEYYLNSDNAQLIRYKQEIINYLKQKAKTKPLESIKELRKFAEIEPEERELKWLLLTIYKEDKQYLKALEIIANLREYSDEESLAKLKKISIQINQLYIDELEKSKKYGKLLSFLQELRDEYPDEGYYLFRLASLHSELRQYDESIEYLQELQYDTLYTEQADNLLQKIAQEQEILQEYRYKIPLKREGLHFSVAVTINEMYNLQLLLDTGATYTLIDSNKVSELPLVKEDIILQTAAGNISANLAKVESFKLDNIVLKDIKVTLAPFEHQSTDGLLGMNFFKRYKFLIDQEEGMLYLKSRE